MNNNLMSVPYWMDIIAQFCKFHAKFSSQRLPE